MEIRKIFEEGNQKDIIDFFIREENILNIKEGLDLLKQSRNSKLQKRIICQLEKIGNDCLTKALDAQSRLAVCNPEPEERKELKKEKEVNFQKAKIFFSLFALS